MSFENNFNGGRRRDFKSDCKALVRGAMSTRALESPIESVRIDGLVVVFR